ncbi:MAG: hypothetical protein JRC99_00140 [Deltaproteobacteria bacterium]|nr:hypothetical protein [Deltaproteobacteria bacterium]
MAKGVKGVKAKLEPKAKELYALGYGVNEISDILDVSENTLRKWKSESKAPSLGIDGWDLSRQQSYELLGDITRLIQTLVREATANPKDTGIPDAVAKWSSVARNMREDKRKASEWIMKLQGDPQEIAEYDKAAVFISDLEFIIRNIKEYAPAAIELIVEHLPQITENFKATLK